MFEQSIARGSVCVCGEAEEARVGSLLRWYRFVKDKVRKYEGWIVWSVRVHILLRNVATGVAGEYARHGGR